MWVLERADDRTNHEQSPLLTPEQARSPLSEEEQDRAHIRQVSSWKTLPWWKRPSPYWLIFGVPFGSIGYAALLAPKVALYTTLACRVHRPEYVVNNFSSYPLSFSSTNNLLMTTVISGSEATVDAVPIRLLDFAHTTSSDYDFQQKCASDPVVQAVVARLSAIFATFLGILACLTSSWWGSLSDRHGRRIVIFASMFGLFVTDATHVITAWFVDVLPGGYWFPLIGSLIEGLCGGMPTGVAMNHAYLADTTDPSTRSRYFSLSLGLMFAGVAVGPVLGGLLIRSTGSLLSVFYFATILHGIYAALILLFLPESLTQARAWSTRLRRSRVKANQISNNCALGVLKDTFFGPLVVLVHEQPSDAIPLQRRRRDWGLFFIAAAYALVTGIPSSAPYKFQYAAARFHWTPEITSYFVSFVGATRTLFLALALPLVIKYLKAAPVQPPSSLDEPLRGAVGSLSRAASSVPGSAQMDGSGKRLLASRSPVFDLALARTSVVLDAAAHLGMAFAGTGALYTLAATISSFAAGFSPAVQALALDIYASRRPENKREVGKLFGALSVIQALASQIVNPALYGFVYSNTVAVFPQAIMVVSLCAALLALALLSFVRAPSESAGDRVIPEDGDQRNEHTERLDGMENEAVMERRQGRGGRGQSAVAL